MAGVLNSIDTMISSAQGGGMWRRAWCGRGQDSPSSASATSGYITGQRYPETIAAPTPGAGYSGMYVTYCRMHFWTGISSGKYSINICALEYLLGTLTVSGNSFADGVAMPSKTIQGTSVQTCADMVLVCPTTTLTATTPVVTVTYKNERGTSGHSAAMTLPTSAAKGSAFMLGPYLQAGDTGVQDVTNISISTGSAGVLKIYGLLLLGCSMNVGGAASNGPSESVDMFATGWPPYLVESGESISFYQFGDLASAGVYAMLAGVGETS